MDAQQTIQRIIVILLVPRSRGSDLIVVRDEHLLLAQISIVVGRITTGAGALQTIVVENLSTIPVVAGCCTCQDFGELLARVIEEFMVDRREGAELFLS